MADRVLKADFFELDGKYRYFDKNGTELFEGDKVMLDGKIRELYLTVGGMLGIDFTHPYFIKIGRAQPCEYGVYPLNHFEMKEIEKVEDEADASSNAEAYFQTNETEAKRIEYKNPKGVIIYGENGRPHRYFDKNGTELFEGDYITDDIQHEVDKLWLTAEGELGVDATNPAWIERGDAEPGEYGAYPLAYWYMEHAEKVEVKETSDKKG